MIQMNKSGAQGDLYFKRIDNLPSDVVPISEPKVRVAASHLGHHHSIALGDGKRYFESGDPFTAYLEVENGSAELVHEKPDGHESWQFGPGVYLFRRQRESGRVVED